VKICLIILVVIYSSSISLAETYKWEDANGIHITDNASSIPEKYKDKALTKAREGISRPQESINPAGENTGNKYDVNLERKPNSEVTIKPKQPFIFHPTSPYTPKSIEQALEPLARFTAGVILFSVFLSIVWLSILVDIIRSEFTDSSNKTLWILLVILLPPLGLLLYLIIGLGQKKGRISQKEKDRIELLARISPDKSKEGEFKIR
jgi:hypothetical protein